MSYFGVDLTSLSQAAQSTLNSAQSSFESSVSSFEKSTVGSNLQNIFALDNLQDGEGKEAEGSSIEKLIEQPAHEKEPPRDKSATQNPSKPFSSPNVAAALTEELHGVRGELSRRAAECESLQRQLLERTQSLSAEQSQSAGLRAEIKSLLEDKQSLQERLEDEIKMSKRSLADVEERCANSRAEIEALTSSLAAAKVDLAAAAAIATAKNEEAQSPSPSPGDGKGKGKGKGGGNGGGPSGDGGLQKAQATVKQLQAGLTASEAKKTALEEKLEALRAQLREFEDSNTSLERKGKRTEEELEASKREAQAVAEGLNARLASLATQASARDAEKSKMAADLSAKLAALEETEKDRDASKAALDKSRAEAASIKNEMLEIRSGSAAKDTAIEDLQGKLKALTEKTKDVMKKYAETKAKSQLVEEGAQIDSQKALQAKESELLSLRLKLENSERVVGDQRAMATELADRFSDTQRELSRAKVSLEENALLVSELQRELQQAISATSGLASEATATQQKLEEEEKKVAKLTEKSAVLVAEWEAKLSAATKSHALKTAELQLENESLLLRLKSEDETATALEEYKKRAQVALRKANETSSSLVAEIAEKKKLMDDCAGRLAEAESELGKSRQALLAKAEELSAAKIQADSLQQRLDRGQAESDVLGKELAAEKESTASLTARLAEATAVLSSSSDEKRAQQTASLDNQKEETDQVDQEGDEILEEKSVLGQQQPASPLPVSSWAVAAASSLRDELFPSLTTPAPSARRPSSETPPGPCDDAVQVDGGLTLQVKGGSSDQLYYVNRVRAPRTQHTHTRTINSFTN